MDAYERLDELDFNIEAFSNKMKTHAHVANDWKLRLRGRLEGPKEPHKARMKPTRQQHQHTT